MKKLISLFAALLVAAGAMTVSSCATSHDDLEPVAIPGFIVGGFGTAKDISASDSVDVGDNKFYAISFSDGIAEFSFTQVDNRWTGDFDPNSMSFQLALAASWDTVWKGAALELNGDYKEVTSSGENISVKGLTPGDTYKILIKMEGSKVSVKIEGKAPEADVPEADVSALNSKTAGQKGAYFRIGGANYGDSAQQVLFADGKATGYILLQKGAKSEWGEGYFQLYAYFGAGDNGSTLKNKEAQVYFPKTTLEKPAKISSKKDEANDINNLQVTDMQSDASTTKAYKFVVETTETGATITVTPVP